MHAGPCERLLRSVEPAARFAVGRILDHYAWYLEWMSSKERREALASARLDFLPPAMVNMSLWCPGTEWSSP